MSYSYAGGIFTLLYENDCNYDFNKFHSPSGGNLEEGNSSLSCYENLLSMRLQNSNQKDMTDPSTVTQVSVLREDDSQHFD